MKRLKGYTTVALAIGLMSNVGIASEGSQVLATNTPSLSQPVSPGSPTPLAPVKISMAQIQDSPVFKENGEKVIAVADDMVGQMQKEGTLTLQETEQIKGWFKKLPFKRIIDIDLILPGMPEGFGVCLTGHPDSLIAIEACASSMVMLQTLSLAVKVKALYYINIIKQIEGDKVSFHGNELSLSPGIGLSSVGVFSFVNENGMSFRVNPLLSADWVYWFNKYFGLGLGLQGGVSIGIAHSSATADPLVPAYLWGQFRVTVSM